MQKRLFLSFLVVGLAAVALMFLLVRQATAGEVRTFLSRGGMMGLDRLATALEDQYARTGSWDGAEETLSAWRSGQGMNGGMMGKGPGGMMSGVTFRLKLAGPDGRVIAVNQPGEGAAELTASERENAIPLNGAGGEIIGYLVAEGAVVADPQAESDLLNRLLVAALASAGIALVLALLLAWVLSARLLKPVEELTGAARALAAGDLNRRVQARGTDEVAALGAAFNHMAGELQSAEEQRRAMTADIAHELRTPIAVQRAHLEALQDGVYPLTLENLVPVQESAELLTRLVEDLRTLALADAGELILAPRRFDLAELVGRVVERFKPEAEGRQVRISIESASTAVDVDADPARVEQILNNLLSNALRYTPEGGQVWLSLSSLGKTVEVRVADTGPGIPAEAMPRLFERFYRADRARSREQGGTGLGLAIARQLAAAHGGDLSARNRPEGGAEFLLSLPRAG